MTFVDESQQSEAHKARNLSGGILQFQVCLFYPACVQLYRIQHDIVKSKGKIWVSIRVRMLEELEPVIIDGKDAVQHIEIADD